ncbi:carboxymuconolactone decarboxylase family protein [Gordonia hydrophobica]|uniref:Carboxymuconolactone decarboxylase family protein n=1 Tax=Gordonia hydrophobica TaxID=40516 RepID=A0ABZ2TZ75_9ACTN|nr:carboxymuconolactone decarboxylase family protein [Gordonia hydrophobica]MBM7368905.1 AhpD family alkylhydroperoxidase [Gordonia hydrophobica]
MPTSRVSIDKQTPSAYRALVKVSTEIAAAAESAGLPRAVMELVNMHCSQLNGCAFCLSVHREDAVAAGLSAQQLAVLPAWRDAPNLYTDEMRAALELAEIVTTLPNHDDANCAYERAADILDADQISVVIWGATSINAFNRVSILSRYNVHPRP